MRTILIRTLIFAGAAIVLLPLIYGILARIVGASVTGDVIPPVIVAPEPPLTGDTTMKGILEIAGAVEWPDDDACARDGEAERDADACAALVAKHAPVVERLVTWAEDSGPLGPRERDAIGRHARAPVGVGAMVELPPLTPQLALADLLALATEQAFAAGDREAGEKYLRLMFDLGGYFEHNPSTLLHEMVGVALTNDAVLAAVRSVPAESADAVAAWLPAEEQRLMGLQLALGAEWLNLGQFLDHELRQSTGPFAEDAEDSSTLSWGVAEAAGLYDPVHTRQLHDRYWAQVQDATRAPPLIGSEIEVETWATMGVAKYVHNPVGRLLFTIAVPGYARFGARVGNSMDRVAGLRVILAARRFRSVEGRWPQSPDELGPEWPQSAMNGKPLFWNQEDNVLHLFAEDGDGLCTDRECLLPLALPD